MENREKDEQVEAPHVDFSMQLNLNKGSERVEQDIFNCLKSIANQVEAGTHEPLGALVVLGDFEKFGPQIDGMVQMKPKQNPVESLMLMGEQINNGETFFKEFSMAPFDGAIVINQNGQILGAGIYLVVDNPLLETPDDCGTRHKAAASFSERNDVISVLTLSEETNTARLWKKGKTKSVFRVDPDKK